MSIPFPPDMPVSVTEIEYADIVGDPMYPPVAIYTFGFGNRQKVFLDTLNPPSIYEKPVSIVNGVTTHLPDPDLIDTNDEAPV